MELQTEHLILREMTESDFDSLKAVLADSDIMHHYPYTFDDERIRDWIKRNIERYRIFGFGLWAVCLKDNCEMIGDCGLTMQMIGKTIKPEIGYHIRKDMQRRGFAREAAFAVRDWTFKNTTFNEIYSYMKSTNEPSAKCAQSWGCKFAEEFKDEENEITKVFCITREEWTSMMNLKAYDVSASSFDKKIGSLSNYDEAYNFFASFLKKGDKILDSACGPGNISRYLNNVVSDLDLTLMDLSSNMLEIASSYLPNARILQSNICDFELNEKFDAIINGFGLPYLFPDETEQHFKTVYNHLKAGGIYYVSFMDVNAERYPGKENYVQEEHPSFNPDVTIRVNYHSQDSIVKKLTSLGFELLKKWNLDYKEPDGSITTDVVLVFRRR